MIAFKGFVFVGTGRGPIKDSLRHRRLGLKSQAEINNENYLGAQVWRLDPRTGEWALVYDSPVVNGPDGGQRARDRSVRAHAVFQGINDPEPALYLAIGSLDGQVVIVKSHDGEHFAECGPPGLGQNDEDIASVRTLCVWQDMLHTSPTGKNRGRGMADDNVSDIPAIFANNAPCTMPWQMISEPGFGDPDNLSINEMVEFAGSLYAATVNRRRGFQVWKAQKNDAGTIRWKKIITNGAFRGPASPIPAAMTPFANGLYIGSGLQRQGRGGDDRFGPVAPELIRINPDDSWDLIAGEPRCTPHGFKRPLSGMGPGFDNIFVQAFWRMVEYDGHLYLGTSDWRFWPSYLPRGAHRRLDLSPERLTFLQEQTQSFNGDYELWCSHNGVDWLPVTTDGLGEDPYQYGIREMTPTPHGLFVVPASSRGSETGGGLEVWLGKEE